MISFLIPFRGGEAYRDRACAWVVERLRIFSDAEVILSDSGPGEFSRSVARNRAIAQAQGDVLVMVDADTAIEPMWIRHAVNLAELGQWVIPYQRYYNMTQEETDILLGRPPTTSLREPMVWEHLVTTAVSGIIVLPRAAVEAVGGYDERFQGWGYEDNSFQLAVDAIWGSHIRLDAYVVHLWHPIPPDGAFESPNINHNRALWRQYEQARGNPDRMRKVIGL